MQSERIKKIQVREERLVKVPRSFVLILVHPLSSYHLGRCMHLKIVALALILSLRFSRDWMWQVADRAAADSFIPARITEHKMFYSRPCGTTLS
jgi:hypothetical protein